MSDRCTSDTEQELWWGQPLDARRFHVFEGKGRLAESVCSAGWAIGYDGLDPDVDPENDTFKEGRDCKECARKVGILDSNTEEGDRHD